jgi:hypothetical protein
VRRLVAPALAKRPTPRYPPSPTLVALSAVPVDPEVIATPAALAHRSTTGEPGVRLVASRREA